MAGGMYAADDSTAFVRRAVKGLLCGGRLNGLLYGGRLKGFCAAGG